MIAAGGAGAGRALRGVLLLVAVVALSLPASRAAGQPADPDGRTGSRPDTLPADTAAASVDADALPVPPAPASADVGVARPAEEARHGPTRSLTRVLEGRIPGLRSAQTSGLLGSSHVVRVRGPTSLNANSAPMVFVDGVRVDARTETGPAPGAVIKDPAGTSRLDELDPRDVRSVRLLKGPAAASIHGPGADAGVLLVETRRGASPGLRVEATVEQGIQGRTGSFADDYLNVTTLLGIADPGDPRLQPWSPERNPATGDVWVRFNPLESPLTEPFRDGRLRSWGAVARGEAGILGYYASARRDEDDGVLPANSLGRSRLRGNLDVRLLRELDVSVGAGWTGSDARIPANGSDILAPIIQGGLGNPVTAPAGGGGGGELCLGTELGAPEGFCEPLRGNATFPFGLLSRVPDREDRERLTATLSARWRPTAWLGARLSAGTDRSEGDLARYVDPGALEEEGFAPELAGLDLVSTEQRGHTANLSLTARATPGERLTLTTTLGGAYHGSSLESERCTASGFPAGLEPVQACTQAFSVARSDARAEMDQRGAFLSERVGWAGVLFLDGSLRVDDFSGADDGSLWSPGAGASVVLHRMPFWPRDAVDELRVRAAWGTTYRATPFRGPVRAPAAEPPAPEETEELEVGLDAGLLDGRVDVSLTHFRRTSRNLRVLPGFRGPVPEIVVGEIENHGFEAAVGARVLEGGPVSWDVELVLDTRDPVVTDYDREPRRVAGNSPGIIAEGRAPGAMFAPVVTSAERDGGGAIVPGSVVLAPGDLAGTDFVNLGSPEPTNGQTLASTLRLPGGVELFTLVDRVAGHVKFDRTSLLEGMNGRLWAFRQVESSPEVQAALEAQGPLAQGLFVEEADFVRWRELSVCWDVPASWTDVLPGPRSQVSLTVGGRNLHTWTGYSGLDPETRTSGGVPGFTNEDTFTLPPVRSWFARLSVGI